MEIMDRKAKLIKTAIENEILKLEEEITKIGDIMIYWATQGYLRLKGDLDSELLDKNPLLENISTDEATHFCYREKERLEKKRNKLIEDMLILKLEVGQI